MEIHHQYVRPRRHFGRHAKFADGGAEMAIDVRPNSDHAAACVVRNPVATAAQCAPDVAEHEANTAAVVYASKGMSHAEGGWPKDVDPTEAEHTIRCEGSPGGWCLVLLLLVVFFASPLKTNDDAPPHTPPPSPSPPGAHQQQQHTTHHDKNRYRKKVEKDEAFVRALARMGATAEAVVRQNNAVDIYEEYFAGECQRMS